MDLRVGYLYQDDYPWDIRIEKITTALVAQGMPTTIVCKNSKAEPPCALVHGDVQVSRLMPFQNNTINTLHGFPAFFSPFWLGKLSSVVKAHRLGLIIVRDLPMAATAVAVGRWHKIPVLMDMAEDYPAMIADTWKYRGASALDHLIRNPKLLRKLEAWVIPRLSGVIAVSDESAQRVDALGAKSSVVVENTPVLADATAVSLCPIATRLRDSSALNLLYVGGMEEMRGLDEVVEALPALIERLGAVEFTILGDGTSRRSLEQRVRELGLEAVVHFEGFVDQSQVPQVIAHADIGLIPHKVTDHTNSTIPNKIYDYMAQGLPVVVSSAATLKRIVDTYQCGQWFETGQCASLVEAIVGCTGPSAADMGKAGAAAVRDRFNWGHDAAVLGAYVQAQFNKDMSIAEN